MTHEQDVLTLVSAALGGSDLADAVTLDSVTITPAGKRRVVRITLDRHLDELVGDTSVEPLSLDEIADATRVVSEALDASDVMGAQPYTLEVTTPGTSRPLTGPAHFRRNVGRLVTVVTPTGEVTGRVVATSDDGVELEVPAEKKTPARREHVPYADLTKGTVQVEFSRRGDTGDDSTDDDSTDEPETKES